MEFRNLTRYFTFKVVLNKRNKSSSIRLTQAQFTILFVIHYLTKKAAATTTKDVFRLLAKMDYDYHIKVTYRNVKALEGFGLIGVTNPGYYKIKRYSLTFEGLTELQEFERLHRLERLDR